MAKSDTTVTTTHPRSPLIGAGHQLAIDMMIELQGGPGEDDDIDYGDCTEFEEEYKHGVAYRNVVGEWLEKARQAGPEVEQGFTMILNHYLGTCLAGSVPDIEHYEQLMERGVIAAPGCAP